MNPTPASLTGEEMGEKFTAIFSANAATLQAIKEETEKQCKTLEAQLQAKGFNSNPMYAMSIQIATIQIFLKALSNDEDFDLRFASVLGVILRENFLQAETEMNRAMLLRGVHGGL